jgi:DNA-directed RNA polymerase subunit RPC12/RpoP
MKEFFKKLFCKHDYWKTGWDEEYDEVHNERYTIRYYTCQKCGKKIVVDGRYDPYVRW